MHPSQQKLTHTRATRCQSPLRESLQIQEAERALRATPLAPRETCNKRDATTRRSIRTNLHKFIHMTCIDAQYCYSCCSLHSDCSTHRCHQKLRLRETIASPRRSHQTLHTSAETSATFCSSSSTILYVIMMFLYSAYAFRMTS